MKLLFQIFRFLLAAVFIFSGFVKGIDPLGSAYKFGDYFAAFHLDFLQPTVVVMAFILCAAELLIGLLLLFGIKMRFAAWSVLLFMAFFTPLTLVLAIFNPVSDCGCFGDAIKLSNWGTFFKNLVFLAAAVFVFIQRKKFTSFYSKPMQWALILVLSIVALAPSFHGYYSLPMFDFRPYKIGVNFAEAMEIPEGAPVDEYKTIFIYEKDGVKQEFDETNFPWQDSTWTFVDSKSTLVNAGYTPPITNFSLVSTDGNDATSQIVHGEGYMFLAIAYRLDKTSLKAVDRLNQLYFMARDKGIGFYVATASGVEDIDAFVGKTGAAFPFLMGDEIMLKTIIRSNPGLLLIKDGTILYKWHSRNLPDASIMNGNLFAHTSKLVQQSKSYILIYTLVFALVLFWLLSLFFHKTLYK
ncbi:MAG: DoxX family membrane protein [Tenuifilaceae bacterium]|jgi:uncharacterized membrane protein YphA (DoxX/SURF4 family)|nr:DoxX family membrane protein [Tenuifilaceae bacterium]